MKRLKCKFCGRGFISKRDYAKFCSSGCRNKFWRENNPDKVAAHNFFRHRKPGIENYVTDIEGLISAIEERLSNIKELIRKQKGN